ncbi:1,4-dihydroxy-2-naphthoate octaprenyltransferase [Emticicia aquatica]|uniref:1,4-dihydroxy-2-naphthoate octaprenyltransferase n=1 Tax=Emticicia aquatica TaxID=1681835 RepID=A0ABN8EWA8_9BACT|nr:UbiA family prenyltransferase [Emticicia aquatica]CAH0997332.1 1,4-dihydroxy-2-naphthoate octaprenyltransferase [Emticicia aquatica]
MTAKDILLHFRLPFSFFLMPVYWFAISQTPNLDHPKAIWIFIILHVFIYPASNAYNSYFDKDEGSIGGLENPPAVDKKLFWASWIVDFLAILISFFVIDPLFAGMILIYGLVSKAYSNDKIRLKKYPILSWFIVGLFQGAFTYFTVILAFTKNIQNLQEQLLPAIISTIMLWAVYPMSQIYQHEEDAKRGDTTLSILLGIKGTFVFTAIVFSIAFAAFFIYFTQNNFIVLLIFNFPTLVFFGWWFLKVWKDKSQANFKNTMWLNLLASICLNGFYVWLCVK